MIVSKTLCLDAKDIVDIEKYVKKGYAENASDFVQKAVKLYFNSVEALNETKKV